MKKTFNNQEVFDYIAYEKSRAEHEIERALNIFNSKCRDLCKVKRVAIEYDVANPPNVKCKIDFTLSD